MTNTMAKIYLDLMSDPAPGALDTATAYAKNNLRHVWVETRVTPNARCWGFRDESVLVVTLGEPVTMMALKTVGATERLELH